MRVQFSITMEEDVKEKIERLAGLDGISFSMYVEGLCRARINSIEAKLWDELAELRRKAGSNAAAKPVKKAGAKK